MKWGINQSEKVIVPDRACQDLQERTLFVKNAVPGGEIGWLFAGHARALPGR